MTNQEAKFTLSAYRASGQDAGDPAFAEALRRTQNDPQLGAWFERARAHDATVGAKLREIAPPAELRAAILAGARASTTHQAWWRQPVWLAAAAAVIMLLAVAGQISFRRSAGPSVQATQLAELALSDLSVPGHRGHDAATGEMKAWLDAPDGKLTSGLNLDFAQMRAQGCRTLNLGGRDVVEVCFERKGLVFHLYALPRDAMPELPARAAPALVARATQAAAVWSDSKFHYVLATAAGMDALKRLL
jgi:hypothetical protein